MAKLRRYSDYFCSQAKEEYEENLRVCGAIKDFMIYAAIVGVIAALTLPTIVHFARGKESKIIKIVEPENDNRILDKKE
ncbi:hypothetical protein HYW76_00700 [Candidatus Pacearchaeota archaeon]|nr:hypothetical protein [Candidatus Pacearchaeota archaeon]